MNLTEFITSKYVARIIVALAVVSGMLFAFGAGMTIGYNKAKFVDGWGKNYERNVIMPMRIRPGILRQPGFMDPHGTDGVILKINGQSLVVQGKDRNEKIITVSDNTLIRNGDQTIRFSNLNEGQSIVVIGAPTNEGQILAKFIRVLTDNAIN